MNFKKISQPNFKAIIGLASDPLFRNSFFMAATSIFTAGCGFLFLMVAARLYSVEEVGLATAIISSITLIVLFSRLGFDTSIIRFFPTSDKAMIFGTCLVITTVVALLMGAVFIMLIEFLAPSMAFLKQPGYALIFLLIAAANSVAAITGSAFIADRNADHYLFQNIFMALKIPLLLPLAFLGAIGIVGSSGLAFLVASFFALVTLRRSLAFIRPQVDLDFVRRSLRFSSKDYSSSILSIAPTLILPIMVLNILGEAEAAKYSIAFAISNVVLIIPESIGTSLFVEGSHGVGLKKSVIRAGSMILVLIIPAVLVLYLFGYQLLGILGDKYVDAFGLLRVFALSSFFVAINKLFIPIQRVRMRMESLVMLNAIKFMLLLGLSYVYIQQYGIIGAGYGWMATYGIVALGIGGIAKKEGWI